MLIKKEKPVHAHTGAWYSAATRCVGARTVSLITVRVLEYFLVHFQAFPQQCCVGTVVSRSLDRDTPLCGPDLQSKLYIHRVELSVMGTKGLFIIPHCF